MVRAAGGVTTSSTQAHSTASHRFSGKTRLVALLGSPVAHSRSPKLQNGVFAALGVDLAYLAFDVPLPKLEDAVRVLTIADFGAYADVDGDALAGVRITTPPLAGTLEHNLGTAFAPASNGNRLQLMGVNKQGCPFTVV